MKSIKGTQTEKNLLKSFAGESQARNRYTFSAKVAEKEGFYQIADIFIETAENERVHAKTMFNYFEGGMVEITASYPAGGLGTTETNLSHAAEGEREEHTILYPGFAKIAEEEGFKEISAMYRYVAGVEVLHEKRYLTLLSNIQKDLVFKRPTPVRWKCRKCGHIHEGLEAPNTCPTCKHTKNYFELAANNW
ncbi:MAG: rubrerythrin family protein [Chitinivibrionales bacterium]|nr:rubrerythrin family protein [Chitinivibrionales bacterium]